MATTRLRWLSRYPIPGTTGQLIGSKTNGLRPAANASGVLSEHMSNHVLKKINGDPEVLEEILRAVVNYSVADFQCAAHARTAIFRCLVQTGDKYLTQLDSLLTKAHRTFSRIPYALNMIGFTEACGFRYDRVEHYLMLIETLDTFMAREVGPWLPHDDRRKRPAYVSGAAKGLSEQLGLEPGSLKALGKPPLRLRPRTLALSCELHLTAPGVNELMQYTTAGGIALTLGALWRTVDAMLHAGMSSGSLRKFVERLNVPMLRWAHQCLQAGSIDLKMVRALPQQPLDWYIAQKDLNLDVLPVLKAWSDEGHPCGWSEWIKLGGTTDAWQQEAKRQEQRKLEREAHFAQKQAGTKPPSPRPKPIPTVSPANQTPTGRKRHHPGHKAQEQTQEINWGETLVNLVEMVQSHLDDVDDNLSAGILLSLIRSGDRLMPRSRWPKMKLNKLRREVKRLVDGASNREINAALGSLEAIRLVRQTAGKYHISETTPRHTGAAEIRKRLISLCSS